MSFTFQAAIEVTRSSTTNKNVIEIHGFFHEKRIASRKGREKMEKKWKSQEMEIAQKKAIMRH
jgi:hypothetical protein